MRYLTHVGHPDAIVFPIYFTSSQTQTCVDGLDYHVGSGQKSLLDRIVAASHELPACLLLCDSWFIVSTKLHRASRASPKVQQARFGLTKVSYGLTWCHPGESSRPPWYHYS